MASRIPGILALTAFALAASTAAAEPAPGFQLQAPGELKGPVRIDDYSLAAGFADLGLRLAETGAEDVLLMGMVLSSIGPDVSGQGGGFATGGPFPALAVATLAIALVSPALNALVVSNIGDHSRYRHPLGPLMMTSYLTNLSVDAAVAGLYLVGAVGFGFSVSILGSVLGSSMMGLVHSRTAEAVAPPAAPDIGPLIAQGPAVPMAAARGWSLQF